MKKERKEGWIYTDMSLLAHYFVNGKSLCSNFIVIGPWKLEDKQPDLTCNYCRKEAEKRKKK